MGKKQWPHRRAKACRWPPACRAQRFPPKCQSSHLHYNPNEGRANQLAGVQFKIMCQLMSNVGYKLQNSILLVISKKSKMSNKIMAKITLLRVIPTMAFIHFVTGKSSGILSGILSGIIWHIFWHIIWPCQPLYPKWGPSFRVICG